MPKPLVRYLIVEKAKEGMIAANVEAHDMDEAIERYKARHPSFQVVDLVREPHDTTGIMLAIPVSLPGEVQE